MSKYSHIAVNQYKNMFWNYVFPTTILDISSTTNHIKWSIISTTLEFPSDLRSNFRKWPNKWYTWIIHWINVVVKCKYPLWSFETSWGYFRHQTGVNHTVEHIKLHHNSRHQLLGRCIIFQIWPGYKFRVIHKREFDYIYIEYKAHRMEGNCHYTSLSQNY